MRIGVTCHAVIWRLAFITSVDASSYVLGTFAACVVSEALAFTFDVFCGVFYAFFAVLG